MTKTSTRRRRTMRLTTPVMQDTIAKILASVQEPVAGGEIRSRASQLLEVDVSTARVMQTLAEMQTAGLVHSRRETREERFTRAGSTNPRGVQALLWSLSANVPQRTRSEIIPGVRLGDGTASSHADKLSRLAYYRKNRKKLNAAAAEYQRKREARPVTSKNAVRQPAVLSTDQVIDALIAEVANGRVEKLKARVTELEAQLAEIRKIIQA